MTTIQKLLIANRGEIARRIARTCRAMGIVTVAVCSDPDLNTPIVKEVDEVFHLPGRTPAETYLNIESIIEAARRTGSQAIHPGYGFLAESADFARACAEAALIFLGPEPAVIERMASKLESKEAMAAVGVPVLDAVEVTDLEGSSLLEAATSVGWPLLVKASAGGGGRGIRIVRGPGDLTNAIDDARSEAISAFGDPTLLIEHFVEPARHVEVQIVGDAFGTTAHLFERECSVQRRFQKVVEESPSPAVDPSTRDALGQAAVAAAKAVGYVGVGTVEFLLAPDLAFFFLEMNTRLQVEHPVTEAVTGIDIVRLQILIGEGSPLPDDVLHAQQEGHAVEARLYAEDPARGFAPVTGSVKSFSFRERPGLRVDSAVEAGTEVNTYYDAMLAKIIAWAPTRPEAIRLLNASLHDAEIHGITTNRELLGAILSDPSFLSGDIDTAFLDDFQAIKAPENRRMPRALHAAAAAIAAALRRRENASVLDSVPLGWRNTGVPVGRVTIETYDGSIDVEYSLRSNRYVQVDGQKVEVVEATPNEVVLSLDSIQRRFRILHDGFDLRVDGPLGAETVRETPRFPLPLEGNAMAGSLVAPMPGTVVRLLVDRGSLVERGATMLVIEAMKMEHRVIAPEAGMVDALHVDLGTQVDAGAILAVIRPLDGSA